MTFADIPAGLAIFVDANILIYHFTAHPALGPACTALLERIERQEIAGFTSSHILAEMAHRLMTIEAGSLFGWPAQGIAARIMTSISTAYRASLVMLLREAVGTEAGRPARS